MVRLYCDPADAPAPAEYHAEWTAAEAGALLSAAEAPWAPAREVAFGPALYRTRFRALWSAAALFGRFDCVDDAPWHTRTARDDRLWEEEVVELFLDPDGRGQIYAEIEISPANVVCDLRVTHPWPKLESDASWHLAGLDTRVHAWRDESGQPRGWTAVAALPWQGFATLGPDGCGGAAPAPGSRWRFNVFRIKRPGGPEERERDVCYMAWAVPDAPSFHVPAQFRALVFAPAVA